MCARFDRAVIDQAVDGVGKAGIGGAAIVDTADRVVVDGWLVNGSAYAAQRAGERLSAAQTGYIRHYLVSLGTGVVFVAIIFIWVSFS